MNIDDEQLRSAIAEEAEKLNGDDSVSPFLEGALSTWNFDWRHVHTFLARRVMENHPELGRKLGFNSIREATVEWWIDTASYNQLRQLCDYMYDQVVVFRHDVEERRGIENLPMQ